MPIKFLFTSQKNMLETCGFFVFLSHKRSSNVLFIVLLWTEIKLFFVRSWTGNSGEKTTLCLGYPTREFLLTSLSCNIDSQKNPSSSQSPPHRPAPTSEPPRSRPITSALCGTFLKCFAVWIPKFTSVWIQN